MFQLVLFPALLFIDRNAPYYVYIASMFLFIGLSFFFKEIYEFLIRMFRQVTIKKLFTIYYLLFILIGLFGMDKIFLDDCFLIQFPWKNEKKMALSKLADRLDIMIGEGKLGKGAKVPLLAEEDTRDVWFVIDSDILQLFIQTEGAENYTFSYKEGLLEVEK
ncbi:MAG: hypothetical protein P8Y06_02565 [Patescibacteria group bacterium]